MNIVRMRSNSRSALGEGIVWDDMHSALWWTDIQSARLWRHDVVTGSENHWSLPQRLGSFVLTHEPGVLILGLAKQIARFDTRTSEFTQLVEVEKDMPDTRINDGRADRSGNYIFGTMNEAGTEARGHCYRYTPSGELHPLELPPVAIANSIAFSPDGARMYWCDTRRRRIDVCDYDGRTGQVSRLRVFAQLPDATEGWPDGSTIDSEGCLWNAEWGAGQITRYAPDGRVLAHVVLPVSQPTCMAFGGAKLDMLYVTSASADLDAVQLNAQPDAGAVFEVTGTRAMGLGEARFGHAHDPA